MCDTLLEDTTRGHTRAFRHELRSYETFGWTFTCISCTHIYLHMFLLFFVLTFTQSVVSRILFVLCRAAGSGSLGFSLLSLVQERFWLIVCSLGCLFLRLCKCVRHQQGKANSSGLSNWIYTCGGRPGFIWNKKNFYSSYTFYSIVQLLSTPWLPRWSWTRRVTMNWLDCFDEQAQKRTVWF